MRCEKKQIARPKGVIRRSVMLKVYLLLLVHGWGGCGFEARCDSCLSVEMQSLYKQGGQPREPRRGRADAMPNEKTPCGCW